MKKYIKPQTEIVVVEAEAMLAASDPTQPIQKEFISTETPITSSDQILSKKSYDVWGDDEE